MMACTVGADNDIAFGIYIEIPRTPAVNIIMFASFFNGPLRHDRIVLFENFSCPLYKEEGS